MSTRRMRVSTIRSWGVRLAAGVVLAVLVLSPCPKPALRLSEPPALGYFVKRGARVFRGGPDTTLYPGDLVRLTYSAELPRYLALFNRDARSASLFFPWDSHAARVEPGRDIALKFSVELDEMLGDEAVHAVFCPESFELAPLLAALRDTGELPVSEACQITTLTLHKVPAP